MASPGYRRCPEDTAYPQDTDSVLRIPRYPQDTAGVLRYNYRHDAAVSSGYRVPRMPSVSQDANSRLQMRITHKAVLQGVVEAVPVPRDQVNKKSKSLDRGVAFITYLPYCVCRARCALEIRGPPAMAPAFSVF